MNEQFCRFALNSVLAAGLAFGGGQAFAQQDSSAQQPSPAQAADDIRSGTLAFNSRDFKQAIGFFSDAIRLYTERLKDPALSATEKSKTYYERGTAYDDRAHAYGKLSDFDPKDADEDNAVTDYGAAIAADPKNAEAYRARGVDEWDDDKKAIADFTAALTLHTLDANETAATYSDRGEHYGREKSTTSEAIADYTSALHFDPQDADVYYARAKLYDEQGHHDLAIADFTSALSLLPGARAATFGAGDADDRRGEDEDLLGRHDLAMADFTAAIDATPKPISTDPASGWLDPNDNLGDAFEDRAKDEERAGEYELAIADYTMILKLNLVGPDETATVYHERGDDYDHIGEHAKAATDHAESKEIQLDLLCNQEGYEACSMSGNAP